MNGINQQIQQRQQEAMQTQHSYRMRQANREMRAEIDKIKDQHEAAISRVRKDFDKNLMEENTQLEVKLTQIRNKNQDIIDKENERYERIRNETVATHKEQIAELKKSHQKEADKQTESHQSYIDNARQKFQAEKLKLNA